MCVTVWASGRHIPSRIWEGRGHEIVVKRCRALSYRYPVSRIAEQPERYGNVTNRNGLQHPASQRHGRSAEASGKAATAGGNATRVRSGGTPSGPDIAIHSNGDWDAVGCAGSCHGEACRARERGQQLQRWLRIKLQTRQGPLGWMQRIGGIFLIFLGNVQRHTHLQELRRLLGNQSVSGLGHQKSLVVLQRHAGWGEISGHRSQSMEVAHSIETHSGQLNRVSFVVGQPDRNVVTASQYRSRVSSPDQSSGGSRRESWAFRLRRVRDPLAWPSAIHDHCAALPAPA
jgi:hypothetical protein